MTIYFKKCAILSILFSIILPLASIRAQVVNDPSAPLLNDIPSPSNSGSSNGGSESAKGFVDKLKARNAKYFLEKLSKDNYNTNVTQGSIIEIIGNFIKTALALAGIFFVGLTIYAGYLWTTSGGNEDKVTKSKGLIYNAVIGLIIVLAAYSISWYVWDKIIGFTMKT